MLIAVTAAAVFVLDVVTKWLVQTRMVPGESIRVIPGVLYIAYVRNAGAAFGLLRHGRPLFVAVALAVVLFIMGYGRRVARGKPLLGVSLGLELGGAAGNLLDRIVYGRVVDFIDVRVWPFVFNVADSAIVVGGVLLAWWLLRGTPAEHPDRADPAGWAAGLGPAGGDGYQGDGERQRHTDARREGP